MTRVCASKSCVYSVTDLNWWQWMSVSLWGHWRCGDLKTSLNPHSHRELQSCEDEPKCLHSTVFIQNSVHRTQTYSGRGVHYGEVVAILQSSSNGCRSNHQQQRQRAALLDGQIDRQTTTDQLLSSLIKSMSDCTKMWLRNNFEIRPIRHDNTVNGYCYFRQVGICLISSWHLLTNNLKHDQQEA